MINQFRKQRPGPESDLVNAFLEAIGSVFDKAEDLTRHVLLEPRVGGAFPDVLILAWPRDARVPNPESRKVLSGVDLKIAHYLSNAERPKSAADIGHVLGFPMAQVTRSLGRLADAAILNGTGTDGFNVDIGRSFVLRGIIAVEAKVSKTEQVVRQAELNALYASQSFVLMPSRPAERLVNKIAVRCGVGVIGMRGTIPYIAHSVYENPLPASIHSWFLNEYVIRNVL